MAGVNVKLGVSGVSEFKRSMKESQNSVKTLDAELKKSEAQYKATGDKEKYMADQSKLLKQKLDEQKKAAKSAEDALEAMRRQGVEKTSAEYQNMARQLAVAQTGMYNTQTALNSLNGAQVQASKSAGDLKNNLTNIAKNVSLQNISSGLKSVDSTLKSAANYAYQIGKNLVESVREAASYADDTATLAEMYDIPLTRLLQMQALVDAGLDTSVDAMLNAMTRMKRGVGKESAEAMGYLKQFGLVATMAGGKTGETYDELLTRDPDELFWKAGQGIMAMTDALEQEAAAQAIFGRGWKELKPLFDTYSDQESFNRALENTEINSEDTIQNLTELNDKIGELEHNFQVVKTELLGALAPALTQVSDIISGVLAEFNKYLQSDEGQEKLQELSDAVVDLFSGLKDIKPGDVIDTAKDILDGIVETLKWISENWEGVVDGIKAIVGVWAGIKVTEGITTFMNLINGIRGLGGAGAAAAAGTSAGSGWASSFASAASAGLKAVPWLAALLAMIYPIKEEMDAAGGYPAAIEELMDEASNVLTIVEAALGNKGAKAELITKEIDRTQPFIDKLKEEYGIDLAKVKPVEVKTEPVVENQEAARGNLQEEIGTLQIPANIVPATYWWGRRPVGGGSPLANYMQDVEGREYGHANGLPFVPYEGYYHLHAGERVMTASANRNYTYNNNTYFGNVNLHNGMEVDALTESIDRQNRRHNRGYGT